METKILKRAEEIQESIHEEVSKSFKESVEKGNLNIQYQDLTNVMLYREIARLQLMVEELQNK